MRLRAAEKFLDTEVLVGKEGLVVRGESISMGAGAELDIEAHKSLS